MLRKTSVSMFWCQKLLNIYIMFIYHSSYYANIILSLVINLNYIIMIIENVIRYRNPLGRYVEDFVTDFELQSLFKKGLVHPYDYKLRGNFWRSYQPVNLRLIFVYIVRCCAYPDVL